jgi:ElaB/YqjD/DUF883 family membrane-anchored ribosome-binding protein
MADKSIAFSDSAYGPQNVGQKLTDAAAQATDKVIDLAHSAANQIDANRDVAASGMEKAALLLHEKAESLPGGEKITHLANGAAQKLGWTAGYIREHDVNTMMADAEILIRNNPGTSLLTAAALGFLVGRSFGRSDD